jgi:hypothetical protein
MPHPFATRALLLASLALTACSTESETVDLAQFSAFKDIGDAPAAIKTAAGAVFRIRTARAAGTGSFISADGQLLTNNHVLGIEVCPREGCYASISLHHERGAAPDSPIDVFMKPLHVSVGLDMAVLQAFTIDEAGTPLAPLATPEFLAFDGRDAASLVGEKVYVVGHPEAHLKKWSTGEVATADGAWFQSTAFSLPGNSGSPIVNEAGQIVGLLHRGPSGQDLITRRGVIVYSIGTASSALIAAMAEELPPTMRSIAADVKDEDVVANELVYLNARASTATVEKAPKPILGILAAACDAGLARNDFASPEELETFLEPCDAATRWIDCQVDTKGAFSVCPDEPDKQAWRNRLQAGFDKRRALNGALWLDGLTFAMAALESTSGAGNGVGEQRLRAALDSAQPPLDFSIAPYLVAFNVTSYGGADLVDYAKHYDRAVHYELSIRSIVYTALWLNERKKLDANATVAILKKLIDDEKVSLGPKLYIEEVLHASKVID